VQKAEGNGVKDLRWLSREDLRVLETLRGMRRRFSVALNRIIDSHGLMLAYQGDAQNHGRRLSQESGRVGQRR
jgi:hypothetical protein